MAALRSPSPFFDETLTFCSSASMANPRFFTLLPLFLLFQPIFSRDFLFNGFNSTDLRLYGNSTIDSRILTLTNQTSFSIGRALFPEKIRVKEPNSSYVLPFSTSFIFAMAPYKNTLPGHGMVFIFVPSTGINGTSSAQNLGLFNFTNNGSPDNHVVGVEFDVFSNQEFSDINANHVGIDVNSLTSVAANNSGYWPDDSSSFQELKLNSGENYQVWIDYSDSVINVTIAPAGVRRPSRPLMNVTLNLSAVLLDEMYVGFTASTGQLVESHKVLAWSFSNSNFSLSESLITTGLPSFVLPEDPIYKSKWFIIGFAVGGFLLLCSCALVSYFMITRCLRNAKERREMEEWELEYWPHRISYHEIEKSTKGFKEENVIGIGGNGKVFKGVLPGGTKIAVKRNSPGHDGMREFVAEISSIGRLKHRNLVGLKGWCKKEKGTFLLIYDYMENGSLDKKIFETANNKMLSCEERIRILKEVASGVLYLHEGWESQVLHRDIKASNVLLDKDMKGRLGDFGLARVHSHSQVTSTTKVVGTVGYLAPEVIKSGRASTQTDVFGFGVLILEVMCGRRPIEEGKPSLIQWVWEMMEKNQLCNALDEKLRNFSGQFDKEEVEKVLHLGLLCAYPDPSARPTMRQVVKILEGKSDSNEPETEAMDAYLLDRMQSKGIWDQFSQAFGYASSHPTFDDFKQENSSSMSLAWSNSEVYGR